MRFNFIKLQANAKLPEYSTEEAAGADVFAIDTVVIPPGELRLVNTGLGCAIPKGYEIQVRSRSGMALKHKVAVLNSPGTIDSDYTGQLGVILMNFGDTIYTVNEGDRVAQLVCAPVLQGDFAWVGEARATNRTGGFGSTGV